MFITSPTGYKLLYNYSLNLYKILIKILLLIFRLLDIFSIYLFFN
jgi:hypothetical protein